MGLGPDPEPDPEPAAAPAAGLSWPPRLPPPPPSDESDEAEWYPLRRSMAVLSTGGRALVGCVRVE